MSFKMAQKEFKNNMDKVRDNYKGLAKAVGGFTKEQQNTILEICVKNTLLNKGLKSNEIEMLTFI